MQLQINGDRLFLFKPGMHACAQSCSFVEDQGKCDLPAFRHQNVIGAAGGLVIHAFDTYTAFSQRRDQPRMDETLFRTGAKNHDIRGRGVDLLKV